MICVDCRSVAAHPTGLPAYQAALARHLPELVPHQRFQFLRHGDRRGRLTCHPNAHELFLPGDPENALAPLTIAALLDERDINLFHATGGLFPAGLHVPIVTTVHDVLWLTQPAWVRPPGLRGRLVSSICGRFQREALRASARIIVPSQATARAIEEIAPFAAQRVRVIALGVDEPFSPLDGGDAEAIRQMRETCERLLSGAHRFVLDVGRAAAYRNHYGLIRGFASAFRHDRDMHLVLVQEMCGQTRALIELAARLGIDKRLHVLSGLSSQELVALYRGAACLCHPTLHESFGTVVAEAMACGCPVITSSRAAAGEWADGVAQLINPEHEEEIAAALQRLVYEPGVAERMRAKGVQRSELLGAKRMAKATWDVYREVLGEHVTPIHGQAS